MDSQRSPETILRDIACIRLMERGRLSEMRGPGGGIYHSLQFWTGGRNRCEYVAAKDLEAVHRAVANYATFKELVEEYAAAVERRTRRARRRFDSDQKKGSAKKLPRPQRRR